VAAGGERQSTAAGCISVVQYGVPLAADDSIDAASRGETDACAANHRTGMTSNWRKRPVLVPLLADRHNLGLVIAKFH